MEMIPNNNKVIVGRRENVNIIEEINIYKCFSDDRAMQSLYDNNLRFF